MYNVTKIEGREVTLTSANGHEIVVNDRNADKPYRIKWLLDNYETSTFRPPMGEKKWWTKAKRKDVTSIETKPISGVWGDEGTTPQPVLETGYQLPEIQPAVKKALDISLTVLDNLKTNPNLFNPIKTGVTCFDEWLSADGGFQRGTSVMVTGEPGVGKTSVLVEMGVHAQNNGHKVLFISAEMGRGDMQRYLKRFPSWGQLPILFLGEYALEDNATEALESTLKQGWDLVITDSYTEVADTIQEENRFSSRKAEKWFLDFVRRHSELADNDLELNTTFVTILQLTKGGQFVGSNKLKHMTTAMAHMGFDKATDNRYMEFSKNRVGLVQEKLYFDLDNGLVFDSGEWDNTKAVNSTANAEAELSEEESSLFEELLGDGLFEAQEDDDLIEEVEFAEVA